MGGKVHYEVQESVAVLRIDNPPVNHLNANIIISLNEQIDKAENDSNIKAVVVTGSSRAFMTSMEGKELSDPVTHFAQYKVCLQKIEQSEKVYIAALNGIAIGVGLELALVCDYRIASPLAPVGMVQAKMGIIPGCGGTLLLPRLIGTQNAINLLVSGRQVLAMKAKEMGILDEISRGNVVNVSVKKAQKLIEQGATKRRVRDMDDKIKKDRGKPDLFNKARKKVQKMMRNRIAPVEVINSVEAGINAATFEEGLQAETECLTICANSPLRAALVHVYFAEREAQKVPSSLRDAQSLPIQQVGIVGSGKMGRSIAIALANIGIKAKLFDKDTNELMHANSFIKKHYSSQVKKGKINQKRADQRMGFITPAIEMEQLHSCELIIEAAVENLAAKQAIFKTLESIVSPDTILSTNTVTVSIDEIASAISRPEQLIGSHFFRPAYETKLLEITPGHMTSSRLTATIFKLGKRLKKDPIIVGNKPGFVGHRMSYGFIRQAQRLALEGVSPQRVDDVLYQFGFARGPFAMVDQIGIDFGWSTRNIPGLGDDPTAAIQDKLISLGRLGVTSGAGIFRYNEGSNTPIHDPEIDKMLLRIANELGFEQKTISDEDIIKRCVYALVNIGAQLCDEEVAARPSDIDLAYIFGFGFPKYRGGPMKYADIIGLESVLSDIERFHDELGDFWAPSELLIELVEENETFDDLN